MHSSVLARTGVVLTASALAFTLGAGPASAADSTSATATGVAAPSGTDRADGFVAPKTAAGYQPAEVGDATLKSFKLASSVITGKEYSYAKGNITFNLFNGATIATTADTQFAGFARFTVNGVVKSNSFPIWINRSGETAPGADIPRTWGSGKVKIDQIVIATKKGNPATITGTPVAGSSNTFYARKNIKTTRSNNIALSIKRVNKKITFKAHQIRIVKPSTGKYVSAGKVKLQYLSGGKWKTQKNIKLDSKGNGSYKRSTSSKYRYRLYIAKTDKSVEFRTIKSGKI